MLSLDNQNAHYLYGKSKLHLKSGGRVSKRVWTSQQIDVSSLQI
jgi:hypothetical protein